MIAFAALLERLVFTPSRNAKIALLRRYFATQPDPDRGIGLAAITGELSFTAAKPGLIRELAAARTDPVLFDWSYDYVGDLAETVALIWPARPAASRPAEPGGGGRDAGDRAESGIAGPGGGVARLRRRLDPAGAAEADHRRPARRRLRPAGQDRAGGNRRRRAPTTSRRSGTGWNRPTCRCSPGWRAGDRSPIRPTRRCSARRCWRIRWKRRTSPP